MKCKQLMQPALNNNCRKNMLPTSIHEEFFSGTTSNMFTSNIARNGVRMELRQLYLAAVSAIYNESTSFQMA